MPDLSVEDTSARDRIIAHMNTNHQDSIGRYVEHLKGASSAAARNATMTDIALDQVTVTNGHTKWRISLEPPMGSMREARERLVRMDEDAMKALNRSDITIKEYRRPRGTQLIIFVLCLIGYVTFSRKEHSAPGSIVYENLHQYLPALIDAIRDTYPLGLVLMVGIHVFESAMMIRTRLTKHSVPLWSRLWWTWVISTFIEGFGAFQRFDALVREKKAAKEKLKH